MDVCVHVVKVYNGAVSVSVMKDPEPAPSSSTCTHTDIHTYESVLMGSTHTLTYKPKKCT